jgi:transposase-like protein
MVTKQPTETIALPINSKQEFRSTLDDIAREGARRMLVAALDVEVENYISLHASHVDENGHRLVVRNGKGQPRSVTTGGGEHTIKAPRVDDRRDGYKFISKILPPYLRKSPKVESLLPLLYLKGLSTGQFEDALREFLGEGSMGLSPSAIVKLKAKWEQEYNEWKDQPIDEDIVYIWADGVNISIRLGEDNRICLLVVLGATVEGKKKLLAVHPGYRESEESWTCVLNSLVARGLKNPLLAIGDGALGFWNALRALQAFLNTKEQRCWVHKIANVLDKFPKRSQADAKQLLHDMMKAETKANAQASRESFENLYSAKYPKAVECLTKDWETLTAFFSFPAEHWLHLRTTNPIESAFATVKLRTRVTKGAGSKTTAVTMAFKLLMECEKKWLRLRGSSEIKKLREGLEYENGIVIAKQIQQGAAS